MRLRSDLAEDDPVEWPVERELDLHVALSAHDLQVGDVGHVGRPLRLPEVEATAAARVVSRSRGSSTQVGSTVVGGQLVLAPVALAADRQELAGQL